MTGQNRSMSIKEIVDLKEKELGGPTTETHKLNLALQSVQKRIDYCEYHYAEIERFSDKKHLSQERGLGLKYGGISVRTMYEANIFAFVQSLHALIDSLPYGLNIFYKVCSNIEAPSIGWNPEFLSKYTGRSFFASLKLISEDETFAKLKAITNRIKHKHIIRIRNTYESLLFDDFSYYFAGKVKDVKDEDVKKFLADCHDYLLPKYIGFWNEVKNCKASDLGDPLEH
jgi:hypothetical protein